MTIDTINKSLRERFAQPLPDCYQRRIIFWYDSEQEFGSMLDELDLPDVRILCLTGDNFFEAKMLLSETDTQSNYLVYHPVSMHHVWDDWLRDIELYSEEFRADLISMQMDELGIPQTVPFRRAVKLYQTFFGNKERMTKLASLHTKYETAAQLHIDIMAVLSGAKENSAQGVIRAILCESLHSDDNSALEHIRKFGNEDALREMLAKYTGYHADEIVPYNLAKHIMMTALSGTVQPQTLTGLEIYISAENQTFCYNVTDEWAHSEDSGKLFELANDISQELGFSARLEKQGVETLLDTNEEIIIELPEIAGGTLIPDTFEKAGYVYAVGRSVDDKIGVYRLENKLVDGTGKFSFRNVEGLAGAPKSVKDSLTAAFNYFEENHRRLVDGTYKDSDYSLYFNDLQNRNVSEEVSVAEVVGLFSALAARPVVPSLIICGRVVMSGGMMPVTAQLDEIFVASANAGAKKILLPEECRNDYHTLSVKLKNEVEAIFYATPLDAARKALGVD